MKPLGIVLCLILSSPLVAQAPSDDNAPNWLGRWEERIASPTYGVSLIMLNVDFDRSRHSLMLPGVDLRIFNGTNVAKEGGFYTGIEVGTTQFLAMTPDEHPDQYIFQDETGGPSSEAFDVKVEGNFGMVYLLSKYGYRLDLGFDFLGVSLGAEVGLGARLSNGYIGLAIPVEDGGEDLDIKQYWGNEAKFDLLMEGSAQGALRLGKNFRILADVGLSYTPQFFDNKQGAEQALSITGAVDTPNEAKQLLSRYKVTTLPIIITARVGFSVSY